MLISLLRRLDKKEQEWNIKKLVARDKIREHVYRLLERGSMENEIKDIRE